ncbi:hypothetical protein VDGD_08598 [Verticillium dahliae]|nr:hypothetical protein VDGD_08598 [Verticillium dahliae]
MAVWETEDESNGPTSHSLPTPQDTPYRTPSNASRRSRRSITPPGMQTSPPLPAVDRGGKASKRSSKDVSNDDTISVLDPRRFTPTLHANLVAEILNLRRDQEDKIKLIENLEASLHATRGEQEALQETAIVTAKETRSLKRQLALLEGGSSSAIGELARERDEAVESATELKKRLDVAQRKIRTQEDDSQRVHDLWTRDKDAWDEEKRKYERKIHIAETRMKVVLDEVAAYQNAHTNGHGAESEAEETGRETDAASIRTMSMTNSIRFSTQQSPGKTNIGNCLADELNLDGDDDWHTDDGGRESALSHHRHTRNMSRDSVMSRMHRRNQSIESLKRPGSVARGKLWVNQTVLEALEDGIQEDEEEAPPAPKAVYKDTGVQFSPPPSPTLEAFKPATPEPLTQVERPPEGDSQRHAELEIEANQRRKRVQLARPLSIEPPYRLQESMVSAGSQTAEEPLSPPKTPKSPFRSMTPPSPEIETVPMVSASTQTEKEDEPEPLQKLPEFAPLRELSIPSISVIPPTSRPSTPREPRLPLYNKDAACQVSLLSSPVASKSIGVQTEEIRIDQRLARLPLHLHPDTISSRPPSPNPAALANAGDPSSVQFTPAPNNLPPRNPRRLTSRRSIGEVSPSPPLPAPPISPTFSGGLSNGPENTHNDAYPGNNDDGPLSSQKAPMRRPHRISSLFAGFDANSSDEADDFGDGDLSDPEFQTALSHPGQRPKSSVVKPSKRRSSGTATSPEHDSMRYHSAPRSSAKPLGTESYSYSLQGKETVNKDRDPGPRTSVQMGAQRSVEKSIAGPSSKPNGMRRAALIQSGIASHQGRSRSPSLPDPQDPPFPIPTRASSRRPPFSVSAPSDGQRSPTRGEGGWHRRGSSRTHYRANSIRKVRSAAALPRTQRNRRQSRSPPPFSETTEVPESPSLPPLPHNDITSMSHREPSRSRFRSSHRSQPSTNTAQTSQTYQTNLTDLNSIGGGSPTTGVVDAIAQTMVGEWMFKYVRRRKSFGVPETNGKDDNSNDRHKRWVWLAPYERAILWSSKQPNSGSALMGKAGRKLTIQSVLDVKDDNPTPKGGATLFNRSILILTPQRALKFTAVSADRHYIWLTALSFLAHSQQAVPEIITAPPPPKTVLPDFEMPQPKRKTGIRDSIRLTKSKAPSFRQPPVPSIPSIPSSLPSAPSSQVGDVSSSRQTETFPPLPMSSHHQREQSSDAAEPPFIPRFHERSSQAMVHGRKRSNTGGHVPPPLSFRGFSGPAAGHSYTDSNAGNSVGTAGSSDIYQSHRSQASSGGPSWGLSTAGSQRTSEASSRPSNFFDAIGTVRMEAFISPLAFSGGFDGDPDENDEFRYRARRRSKEMRRRSSRSRHRERQNSRSTRSTNDYDGGSKTAGEEDFFRDDPFKGF